MFLASASFSSSVPRSENIGFNEFKRSTYITFYYRSIDSTDVKNYPQKVVQRKEHYGYHVTKCMKELFKNAEYSSK